MTPTPPGDPERFFLRGRLESAPRRRADRDLVRRYVASRVLPLDEPVTERVLTDRLAEISRDPVGLRRDLVEAGLVTRTRDGAEYWRTHVTEFDGDADADGREAGANGPEVGANGAEAGADGPEAKAEGREAATDGGEAGRRSAGVAVARAHTIVYVRDPSTARDFWRATLDAPPQLDVPGMTEFALGSGAVLGLMPVADINALLPALDGATEADSAARAPAAGAPSAEAGVPPAAAGAPSAEVGVPAAGASAVGRAPGVELYLVVDDADLCHRRALAAGATELSPMARRSWGADVAYSLSPDGVVVIAFARPDSQR